MKEESLAKLNGNYSITTSITARDLVAVVFRQRRVVAISFLGTFLGAVLIAILVVANQYEAQMKILVKHERADPVVTSAANNQLQFGGSNDALLEEELNSEAELLQSQDVLEKVVLACGLQNRVSSWSWHFSHRSPSEQLARAVRALGGQLKVEPEKRTSLIKVSYKSSNPELAAQVLTAVGKAYMDKHLEVHRPPGELGFFQQESEQYQKQLADAEERLAKFDREKQGASVQLERDNTVSKLTDAIAGLRQTQSLIAGAEQRIRNLQTQLASTPARMTTQEHTADASGYVGGLQSTLLTLELKRTELLTKYAPSFPLVQEVENQISQTKAAIASAQPFHDQTTDRDPTYELLREDLAKTREDLASLKANEAAEEAAIRSYRASAAELDQKTIVQEGLLRDKKAAEDNYLLYLHKREEARTADALDTRRILNVAIAETPRVPVLPAQSPLAFGFLGTLFAVVVSLGTAFTSDYFDPSFRTPKEVTETLEVPLLASVPKQDEHKGANGT